MKVTIKAHDTGVVFTDTLLKDGVVFDLTDCTVKFLLSTSDKATSWSFDANVDNATDGTVSYQVDIATDGFPVDAGNYLQEWEVTNTTSGNVLTFPSKNYNKVVIQADLNAA